MISRWFNIDQMTPIDVSELAGNLGTMAREYLEVRETLKRSCADNQPLRRLGCQYNPRLGLARNLIEMFDRLLFQLRELEGKNEP